MAKLFPDIGGGSLLRSQLLASERATRIGAVASLDFHEAVVITNDKWKLDAGGIPQYSFLLATAQDPSRPDNDDDEVLLLRVEGTSPLNLERDIHAAREESLRTALAKNPDPSPSEVLDVEIDPFTKSRMAFTGLRCKVLGTFYEDTVNGQPVLQFGADVDNFYATSSYRVLKPKDEGLSLIASYLKPSLKPDDPVEPVRIGTVRYSATRRRAQTSGEADAAVSVNIWNFIGNKTALLGMTRMGKSNTAKTLIARTFMASEALRKSGKPPIGQLIFDPQGEYANVNVQDGTEIAAIGADHVRIFKFGADGSQPHVKPLNINLFDPNQIDAVQGLIADQISADSGYVADFVGTSFSDIPGNFGVNTQTGRARLLLYGALIKAGLILPDNYWARFSIPGEFQDKVKDQLKKNPFAPGSKGANVLVAGSDIVEVLDTILDLKKNNDANALDFTKDVRWQYAEPIYSPKSGNRGYRNLSPLRPFHSPHTQIDPAVEIYDSLVVGKIVIVDLHIGAQEITQSLSKSITARLLNRQTDVFTSGKTPPSIQVMLEEAHNLFGTDKYKDNHDVWVRLAKEASKLNLGMTYATQEVTGVAHQVLANTANWVVAHLNNKRELRALGDFYDFSEFSDAIISSEDRGFVRLKSLSSPYIVPVQIDRYDRDLVNLAREAAGDEPLPKPEES